MKTKVLISIFLLALNVYAQKAKPRIEWGPEIETKAGNEIISLLGTDETGFYLREYHRDDLVIEKLDNNLNNPKFFTFEDKDKESNLKYNYVGSTLFGNHILIFKSNINKDEKSNTLFVQEIDCQSMTATTPPRQVAKFTYDKNKEVGSYCYCTSEKKNFLMLVENIPTDDESNEEFNITMFDKSMQEVWKNKIQMPYQNSLFIKTQFICTEEGNFIVLGKLYKDKVKEKVDGESNYVHHAVIYNNRGTEVLDYEIKLEDQFLTDVSLMLNSNNQIICTGFYSASGTRAVDGSFYILLDSKKKSVIHSSFNEFDLSLMTQFMSESDAKRAARKEERGKNLELFRYDVREVFRKEDGGVILVGEQFYKHYYERPATNPSYQKIAYNYNNLLVINYDPQGKIIWNAKVPKRQTSFNDYGKYSSYALAFDGQNAHFIYNDHLNNLECDVSKELKNFTTSDRKGIVVNATIDATGKLTREELFSQKETEITVIPKLCIQINDDSRLLIMGEGRRTEQFGIVHFENK